MEKTLKIGEIGKLAAESRFTYGGIEWVVLDHNPMKKAVLVLAVDVLKTESGETRYMPFDEENKNDFAASSVRAFLNGDFLEELAAAGADKEAFLPLALDLTSDDGLKDYGIDRVTIGIYTDQIYREFRNIIPHASDWHWTATPFSTARNGYEHLVRNVNSSGALSNYYAYYGYWGVRPLCVLKSDILVSFNEDEVKERTLKRKRAYTVEYQNGENQKGTKQSDAVKTHIAMTKNHASIIKQLTDLVPPEKKKESRLQALRDE